MKKIFVSIIISLSYFCFALTGCASVHEHELANEYSHNNQSHWQEVLCEHNNVLMREDHVYTNGLCEVCGYSAFTFEKIENRNEYRVTAFDATIKAVKIPFSHNGFPVTEVGDKAFFGNTIVISIEMPSGILSIGNMAFALCPALKAITIPNSIVHVGEDLFERSSIETIYFSGVVDEWNDTMPSDGKWANGLEHYTVECLNGTIKK